MTFSRLTEAVSRFKSSIFPAAPATPETLPTANAAGSGTPFGGGGTVDTTAQTLKALNPVLNPPAAPAPAPATVYSTPGAAGAACSPAIAGLPLDYPTWKTATEESLPGTCAVCLAAETSPDAYLQYLNKWSVMQKIRQQGGGATLDAVLASMAAS